MIKIKYHVVPSFYPKSTSLTCEPGQVAALNASGQVVLCDGDGSLPDALPIGLIGDSAGTLSAFELSNRASDAGDETAASGQVTVYHGGGEFYLDFTDVIASASVNAGDILVASQTASESGKMRVNNSSTGTLDAAGRAVAIVLDDLTGTSGLLPTGIPNEYAPAGDSDSPRTFALVKLLI